MPLSPDGQAALKPIEENLKTLSEIEEATLQSCSRILSDNSITSVQRIQISNLFVQSATDIRNAITRVQQALQQARQL